MDEKRKKKVYMWSATQNLPFACLHMLSDRLDLCSLLTEAVSSCQSSALLELRFYLIVPFAEQLQLLLTLYRC